MKLITEITHDVEVLKEDGGEGKPTNYYIVGTFMQAEEKNRNGRIYPINIMEKEVKKYNKLVKENRAMGELGHPEGPTVNLERVSHMIKELKMEGNSAKGKAKILKTPMGKIAEGLLEEGAKLGVSSRGMGSLEERDGAKYVGNDFMLAAIDIVADPSASSAFVDGIMEGKEWVWDNGLVVEKHINYYKKNISKSNSRTLDEVAEYCFADFLSKL